MDGAARTAPDDSGRAPGWLPGLAEMRAYRREWLGRDVAAGLALTGILVPAGMAYAEASGLPPITGLYATILPLLAYALVGPSRILILGPDSALVPLIVVALAPFAALGEGASVEHAALLALLVAAITAACGVFRFGFITDLLSMPVRLGYLTGIAVVIVVSQLPSLLGISVEADGVVAAAAELARRVLAGEVDAATLAVGGGCLAVILGLRHWMPGVPGVLVAVAGATVLSGVLNLATRAGIDVIGPLPQGLPMPSLPMAALPDLGALLPAALGIAFVSATDTVILSRSFAGRHRYTVDPDRELIALGTANAAAGLFSGYPISSSASRTAVAEAAGIRSQLAGVVGALSIAALLVLAPGLLAPLPSAALSAVVLAAAVGLIEPSGFMRLWRRSRADLLVAVVTLLAVALVGVVQGILLAIGVSLLAVLRRSWWPHDAVLGRAEGVKGYHDLTFYPAARQIPGLLLYRFDAPLQFFNADTFRERILERVAEADPPARWVVVAAEPITDVDTTAADALEHLLDDLDVMGVTFVFAELKDPVKARLRRYGTLARIGETRCYPTVGTAVNAYVTETGEQWVDWEEQAVDDGTGPDTNPTPGGGPVSV